MKQRVLLALLWGCSVHAMAGDTVLKLYRPFGDVVEQVKPVVTRVVDGVCYSQSQLITREDAWRCQAEGTFYDPCFVKAGGKQMTAVCPQSPWIGDSVQINVTAPLNNEQHATLDMSRTFPWGVELANGEQCQAVQTNEMYDAMPVRYRCSNNNLLIGYLQRCKTVWSMLEKTPNGVVTVDFDKAWF